MYADAATTGRGGHPVPGIGKKGLAAGASAGHGRVGRGTPAGKGNWSAAWRRRAAATGTMKAGCVGGHRGHPFRIDGLFLSRHIEKEDKHFFFRFWTISAVKSARPCWLNLPEFDRRSFTSITCR
jgi:hypothetical protein